MASVNATRGGKARAVNDAVSDARLIGFNGHGMACVWFGGYTFNVYDVTRGWREVRSFTSGDIAGMSSRERRAHEGTEAAIARMKSEDFDPIAPGE